MLQLVFSTYLYEDLSMQFNLFTNQINEVNERLFTACRTGRVADLELALANVDVNETHHEFGSPLITAAYHGHHHIVEMLLRRGANVDQAGYNGCTALMVATTLPIAMSLVNAGANINATTSNDGVSVLMCAIQSSLYDYHTGYLIINYLLNSGVDIEHRANNGVNAHELALEIYPDIARLIASRSQNIAIELIETSNLRTSF